MSRNIWGEIDDTLKNSIDGIAADYPVKPS